MPQHRSPRLTLDFGPNAQWVSTVCSVAIQCVLVCHSSSTASNLVTMSVADLLDVGFPVLAIKGGDVEKCPAVIEATGVHVIAARM